MRRGWLILTTGIAFFLILAIGGCSDMTGPSTSSLSSLSSATSIVSQDLAQLSAAGVASDGSKGVFSIGWKKFVGPDITDAGTIGEAYAVVHPDTNATTIRPAGIDIGTVTLTYSGGSVELTKRITRNGSVLYETFSRGMHLTAGTAVNIPFVANGTYTFSVSGSTAFSAGTIQVTAPASLLSITGHANGDTVSRGSDLTIQWNGGSPLDSVLLRIVPHLRPTQLTGRVPDTTGEHGDMGGPRCHREGHFAMGGPLEGLGPEFAKGVIVTVPNTGSYTLGASDLQTLLSGTEAAELMIGATQVVKNSVTHDGSLVMALLRNGDRIVLHVR